MYTEDKAATAEPDAATESVALTSEEASHATSDWGEINRELLAERLRKAYHSINSQEWYYENYIAPRPIEEQWIAVANDAIAALLEGDRE